MAKGNAPRKMKIQSSKAIEQSSPILKTEDFENEPYLIKKENEKNIM